MERLQLLKLMSWRNITEEQLSIIHIVTAGRTDVAYKL